MASFWIRVNARLADDVYVRTFGRTIFPGVPLWMATATACGLLVTLWGRIADDQEDGNLSGRDDDAIEEWAKWRGEPGLFAQTFRTMFTVDGIVRDWEEYQGPLIERRRKDRLRIAARRAASRGDSPADDRADNGKSPHDTPGDSPADVRATVEQTSDDVRGMSTCNENGNGNVTEQLPPPPGEESRAVPQLARDQIRGMCTPEEFEAIDDFVRHRPGTAQGRWWVQLLRALGPTTGVLPVDVAQSCSDAMIATPPVTNAGPLRTFIASHKTARLASGSSPPRQGGSRAPRGSQALPAPVYDPSANAAAARRLTRDLGDDHA